MNASIVQTALLSSLQVAASIEQPSASIVRTALLAVISPGRLIERPSASIVRMALLVVSPGCLMNGSPLQ
jgi:hypothetical protein